MAAAALAGGALAASSAHRYEDPCCDTQRAPDVTVVDVSDYASGGVRFEVHTPSYPAEQPDLQWTVLVDGDRDPSTGGLSPHNNASGFEYWVERLSNGGTRAWRWNSTQGRFAAARPPRASTYSDGVWTVVVDRGDLGPTGPGFTFRVETMWSNPTGGGILDYVPNGVRQRDGTFSVPSLEYTYEHAPPPAPQDVTAPTARALASTGFVGSTVRLRYTVSDDTGEAREEIRVYRGAKPAGRVIQTSPGPRSATRVYAVSWRAPAAKALNWRFCVLAYDETGNASPTSCAPIRLR